MTPAEETVAILLNGAAEVSAEVEQLRGVVMTITPADVDLLRELRVKEINWMVAACELAMAAGEFGDVLDGENGDCLSEAMALYLITLHRGIDALRAVRAELQAKRMVH